MGQAIVGWLQPSPPVFAGAHRYVFTLYEQVEGFDLARARTGLDPDLGLWERFRWDWEGFARVFLGGWLLRDI